MIIRLNNGRAVAENSEACTDQQPWSETQYEDEAVPDTLQYLLEYFLLGMKPMLALKFAQDRRNLGELNISRNIRCCEVE